MYDLFNGINDKDKDKIFNSLRSSKYNFSKGVNIPKDIINMDSLIIINSGNVIINKLEYNGNISTVEVLTSSDIFSPYFSPFLDSDYEVIASSDVDFTIINLNEILDNDLNNRYYHKLLKNIINIFSLKMLEINKHKEILSNKTIRNKLLSYFKYLSKKHNSNIIYLPFSFTNLASFLCADRSAMNRELKYMKDENLIEIKGRRIKINFYIN